ncbi:hypothetical protein [Eshraghiella crossota]|uniref:hypothetical protein n=1 Tax=Eshraghiella crossota TaxID=45851 RepID=UPI003AB630BB
MYEGETGSEDGFLLCSDGFRHEISAREIFEGLELDKCETDGDIEEKLKYLVEVNKQRKESDNITAVVIKPGK